MTESWKFDANKQSKNFQLLHLNHFLISKTKSHLQKIKLTAEIFSNVDVKGKFSFPFMSKGIILKNLIIHCKKSNFYNNLCFVDPFSENVQLAARFFQKFTSESSRKQKK